MLDSATLHVIRTHVITRSVASNWMRISPDDTVAASVNPRNVIVVWLLADSLQEHDVTQSTTASQAQVRLFIFKFSNFKIESNIVFIGTIFDDIHN